MVKQRNKPTVHEMRTLVIGAGVAGLTCASLLQQLSVAPIIVEREPQESFNTGGYMLGMLPLGGRVLNQLGARDDYFASSIEMKTYEIHREDGSLSKSYDLDFINQKYGSYRGISRSALISVLLAGMDTSLIRYGVTVEELKQEDNKVRVTFSDGSEEIFDLVIVADGLHSTTRTKVLNGDEYAYYNTHWGGWVAWLDEAPQTTYREYWGAASFMGVYPVGDRIGVFIGGPGKHIQEIGRQAFIEREKQQLTNEYPLLRHSLDAIANATDPFYWEFQDCRSSKWVKGNIVLLGDAASGFLPTAGVGASMALDSAAALVDELSRSDREHLDYALNLYVRRQQVRVEKAQQVSRNFGKMMFVKSPVVAAVRDYALRFYTLEAMLKDLGRTIEGSVNG